MFFNILFFNGSILFLSRPFETVLNKITRGLVKVAILTICIPPTVFLNKSQGVGLPKLKRLDSFFNHKVYDLNFCL